MKVGLIRHFEVMHTSKSFKLMSSYEFEQWQKAYDSADTKQNTINIDKTEWKVCYSSDLPRAFYTAKSVYDGKIIKTKQLREVEILPPFKTSIKLPFALWTAISRTSWYYSHKRIDEKRAYDFIADILLKHKENTLIVSHGALMWYLRKALLSNGFSGPRFAKAKNGYLYMFEK